MFRYLKGRLRQLGITHPDLGKELGMSAGAISHRMTCRTDWTISEMYKVLDICRATPEELHIYFPRDGRYVEPVQNGCKAVN